jgi:hypothetical protein
MTFWPCWGNPDQTIIREPQPISRWMIVLSGFVALCFVISNGLLGGTSLYDINYLAVFFAAAAPLLLRRVWYDPRLFGRRSRRISRYGSVNLISGAGYVVMALVFALIVSVIGIVTWVEGAVLGFLVWLGFIFTTSLIANMYTRRGLTRFLVDSGFQLLYLLVMGGVLGGWR